MAQVGAGDADGAVREGRSGGRVVIDKKSMMGLTSAVE